MPEKLLALTVPMPWALGIVEGKIDLDMRAWRTFHRGPLAIHAAAKVEGYWESIQRMWYRGHYYFPHDPDVALSLCGQVLGEVELVQCSRYYGSRWYGNRPGNYALVFSGARRYARPIPAQGQLMLWEWQRPAEVEYAA